jgi:hypothetical protein
MLFVHVNYPVSVQKPYNYHCPIITQDLCYAPTLYRALCTVHDTMHKHNRTEQNMQPQHRKPYERHVYTEINILAMAKHRP